LVAENVIRQPLVNAEAAEGRPSLDVSHGEDAQAGPSAPIKTLATQQSNADAGAPAHLPIPFGATVNWACTGAAKALRMQFGSEVPRVSGPWRDVRYSDGNPLGDDETAQMMEEDGVYWVENWDFRKAIDRSARVASVSEDTGDALECSPR